MCKELFCAILTECPTPSASHSRNDGGRRGGWRAEDQLLAN